MSLEDLLFGKSDSMVFDYVKKGNLRGVKVMLSEGIDVDIEETETNKTMFRMSLELEHFNIAKMLLERDCKVNKEDFTFMINFHQTKLEKTKGAQKSFHSTLEAEEKRYLHKMQHKFQKLKRQYKKMREIIKKKDKKIEKLMELHEKASHPRYVQVHPDIEVSFDKPDDKEVLDSIKKYENGIIGIEIKDSTLLTSKSFDSIFSTCGRLKKLIARKISEESRVNTIIVCPLLETLDISSSPSVFFIKGYNNDDDSDNETSNDGSGGYENHRLHTLILDDNHKIDIPFDLYKSVKHLSLRNCEHVDDDEVEIVEGPNWESLASLNLSHNKITDFALKSIVENIPELRSLSVSNTKISDIGIKHLSNLKHLESLNVGRCPQIKNLVDFPVDLISLDISGNRNLFAENEVETIKELANFRTLKHLRVSNLSLKEGFLKFLCLNLSELLELDVSWNPIFDNWCLESIGENMPMKLEVLNISKCKKVDDFGIGGFLKKSKHQLKVLICKNMNDRFTMKSIERMKENWVDCDVSHSLN